MNKQQDHRFWTDAMTHENNNLLYGPVVSGDAKAREQMILQNIGLVHAIVDRYIIFIPPLRNHRDDMLSLGTLGLIEAVNKMVEDGPKEDPKPTGLMSLCIQRSVGTITESLDGLRVPNRTRRRKIENGERVPRRQEVLLDFEGVKNNEVFVDDPRKLRDLRETLEACAENEVEHEILRLREAGLVDREIADQLGLSLTTIYVMRRVMYSRFLELTGWKGEV